MYVSIDVFLFGCSCCWCVLSTCVLFLAVGVSVLMFSCVVVQWFCICVFASVVLRVVCCVFFLYWFVVLLFVLCCVCVCVCLSVLFVPVCVVLSLLFDGDLFRWCCFCCV